MNILQAKQEIENTIRAYLAKDATGNYQIPEIRQRPIVLMGPPGIGKTQIMEQIADELGIGLVAYSMTHHTRQSAVGLPKLEEVTYENTVYQVTRYTMSEILAGVYDCMNNTGKKEGILFVDEINCVSETLIPAMLQFLQCKTFGNQKLPSGWLIVAAGNPPEYNRSVREFDMVTLDRVRKIDIEADLSVWMSYAKEHMIHSAIISYLTIRPKNFYLVHMEPDGIQFVTARGWEDLSALILTYEKLKISITQEIVKEYLQDDEVAHDFIAYLDLYHKYQDDYGIDDILAGNVAASIYERLLYADYDERISVVNLLLDALTQEMKKALEQRAIVDAQYTTIKREYPDAASQDETYEKVKAEFLMKVEQVEQMEEITSAQLEHAFDFMEAGFTTGQEILIFVTGLTMSKVCAAFLLEHPNDRFLQYSTEFMTGTKRGELLAEMER